MENTNKPNKKIMKHICDGCCNADCPHTKKMKLQCVRDKKHREEAEKAKVLFLDDTLTGEKVDYDKVMELFAKAPKRTYGGETVIFHGGTYSIDEMKRIMPKELSEDKQ